MDHLARGIYFKGQRLAITKPTPNFLGQLKEDAVMTLPFIGIRVGVDEITPTKAIYAVYDPELDILRFVHGDGLVVVPDQVCFLQSFRGNNGQRLHLTELKNRCASHIRQIHSERPDDVEYTAETRNQFPTKSSVTASLTFTSDLRPYSCPALTPLPPGYLLQPIKVKASNFMSRISLLCGPKYDFNPHGFQGRISREQGVLLKELHSEFNRAYKSNISFLDFQHAAFCLSGLKAGLVHFLYEGQNDPQYFVDGLTPPLPPILCVPLETTTGWTVDCFLARFRQYGKLFDNYTYQRLPNPVLWLEAQLEEEERDKDQFEGVAMRPWKGHIDGEKHQPVIDWDILAGLELSAGSGKKYPRLLSSEGPQPLDLGDIIDPKSFKFKDSDRAKAEKEQQRAEAKARAAKVEVMDLTGDDDFDSLLVGHMNRPYTQLPVRTPPKIKSADRPNSSRGFTPINSKRKHDDGRNDYTNATPSIFGPKLASQNLNSQADVTEYDADSEDRDVAIKRATKDYNTKIQEQSKEIKKELSEFPFAGGDDIYSSDREPSQLYATPTKKRLCRRTGSPIAKSFEADPFIIQDIKMEDESPEFTVNIQAAECLDEDQDYFATSHDADSESNNEVMNTSNSSPKTPTPRPKSPKQPVAAQRFLSMFEPKPKKPQFRTAAISTPRTPTSVPTAAARYIEMFNASAYPRSPEAKKFNEACDAFEVAHKSPPNTPVAKHKFQPPAIKEEEESMRVQPPFGVKSESEADGCVEVGGDELFLEHPGGAEMGYEYDDFTGYVP